MYQSRRIPARAAAKCVHIGDGVSDGFAAYENVLADRPLVVHGVCWAHVRRKFHEARLVGESVADKPLKHIGHLYKAHHRVDAFVARLMRRTQGRGQELSQDQIDQIVVDRVDRRNRWAQRWIKYL